MYSVRESSSCGASEHVCRACPTYELQYAISRKPRSRERASKDASPKLGPKSFEARRVAPSASG
jgi:hypothetical protein